MDKQVDFLNNFNGSDELQQKFREQLQELTHPKLNPKLIARSYFLLACTLIAISGGIYGLYIAFTRSWFDKNMVIMFSTFSAFTVLCCLAFLVHLVRELKSGLVGSRKYEKINLVMVSGIGFISYLFYVLFTAKEGAAIKEAVYMGSVLLFFWVLIMTFVIWQTNQWNKEDIILEQKRTQLEIAVLRESLKKSNC